MQPKPMALVIVWHVVLTVVALLVVPIGLSFVVGQKIAAFFFAVILFNLVVSQFSADSRRISALEERLEQVRKQLRNNEN